MTILEKAQSIEILEEMKRKLDTTDFPTPQARKNYEAEMDRALKYIKDQRDLTDVMYGQIKARAERGLYAQAQLYYGTDRDKMELTADQALDLLWEMIVTVQRVHKVEPKTEKDPNSALPRESPFATCTNGVRWWRLDEKSEIHVPNLEDLKRKAPQREYWNALRFFNGRRKEVIEQFQNIGKEPPKEWVDVPRYIDNYQKDLYEGQIRGIPDRYRGKDPNTGEVTVKIQKFKHEQDQEARNRRLGLA